MSIVVVLRFKTIIIHFYICKLYFNICKNSVQWKQENNINILKSILVKIININIF